MNCDFCGLAFEVEQSRAGCAACSVYGGGGCQYVKCPRCGYEMPEEPAWFARVRAFFGKPPAATSEVASDASKR